MPKGKAVLRGGELHQIAKSWMLLHPDTLVHRHSLTASGEGDAWHVHIDGRPYRMLEFINSRDDSVYLNRNLWRKAREIQGD